MSISASASNITSTTARINVSGLSSLGLAPDEGFQVILYRMSGSQPVETLANTYLYNPFSDTLFFNVGGLTPATTYNLLVSVRNEQTESSAGSVNLTLTTAALSVTKTLQVNSATEVNARFEYAGAGVYQLYRASSSAALDNVSSLTAVATSAFISTPGFYNLTDLAATPNSTLWYKVVRREGTATGTILAQSTAQSVTTPAQVGSPPNAPTGASFSGNVLSWSHDGLNLVDFAIEVFQRNLVTNQDEWVFFTAVAGADRGVGIAPSESARNFRVVARNASGRSTPSNVATQQAVAAPVAQFRIGSVSFNAAANQVTVAGTLSGLATGVTARIQTTNQSDTAFSSPQSSQFFGNGAISFTSACTPNSVVLYRVITNTNVVLASGQETATPAGSPNPPTSIDDDYYITRFDVVKKSFALLVVGQVLPAGGLVDGAISTPTDETLTSRIIVDDGTTATPIGSFNFARYGLTHEVRRERIEMGQLGVQFLHLILLKGTLTKALPKLRYFVPED